MRISTVKVRFSLPRGTVCPLSPAAKMSYTRSMEMSGTAVTDTINQNINDYCIDTFYWMETVRPYDFQAEPMYRALSWIEDDKECTY